jgi:hypothetical protein
MNAARGRSKPHMPPDATEVRPLVARASRAHVTPSHAVRRQRGLES